MRYDRRSFIKKAMTGIAATGASGLAALDSKVPPSSRDEERRKLLTEANFGLKKVARSK